MGLDTKSSRALPALVLNAVGISADPDSIRRSGDHPPGIFCTRVLLIIPKTPIPKRRKLLRSSSRVCSRCCRHECRGHYAENLKKFGGKDSHLTKEKLGQFFIDVRKSVADNYGDGTIKGMKSDKFTLAEVEKLHGKSCGVSQSWWSYLIS